MIKVTKKELNPRVFIPYEITILIDSPEEHRELVNNIDELNSLSSSVWSRLKGRFGPIVHLLGEIKRHVV